MVDYPFIREVASPITRDHLRPLDPRCRIVQFSEPLTETDFRKLAEFFREYPDVPLRIYGHYGDGAKDLSFLRHFSSLRGFQADVFEIRSWDGLEFLPDSLESLALGATRKRLSLKSIRHFSNLKKLSLEGHHKDLDVLSGFTKLVYLTLRSITMSDLSLLQPLQNLRSLDLKLGGTKDLKLLSGLVGLRYLELWMVRGLSDISPVTHLRELRYLFLQDLKNVISVPSMSSMRSLRRVHIENLKGLSSLASIAEAPALEELVLVNMRHLPVESLKCFRNHPRLARATVGLGSARRNDEAVALLALPPVTQAKPVLEYVEE
jgi:hypothetical protein